MADKHNIPKDKMHSNCRLLPEDIVCKITQINNIRRANTCDPALKLLNEKITSDIQKHKQNINSSFECGIFPNELKLAKVIPIFKNGDKQDISNYRPISILSFFSKIFEKTMYNHLINFIDKNKILYKYQFGFRKLHSTNHAIISLVEKVNNAFDSGKILIGVFLDFKKTFDTVDHCILLDKLYKYGILWDWFKSYLENRKQYVCYSDISSVTLPITHGVPQGSILGTLLFILYILMIWQVSQKSYLLYYLLMTPLF